MFRRSVKRICSRACCGVRFLIEFARWCWRFALHVAVSVFLGIKWKSMSVSWRINFSLKYIYTPSFETSSLTKSSDVCVQNVKKSISFSEYGTLAFAYRPHRRPTFFSYIIIHPTYKMCFSALSRRANLPLSFTQMRCCRSRYRTCAIYYNIRVTIYDGIKREEKNMKNTRKREMEVA